MSKESKTNAKTPLLYIQQPSLKEIRANMQQSYSSKNAKQKTSEKPIKEQSVEKKPKRRKRPFFEEELSTLYGEEALQEKDLQDSKPEASDTAEASLEDKEPEQKRNSFSFKPLKPFRDMELDEKIDYLSRYINGKAPFPCEFITQEERHRGILLRAEGEFLVIKSFQGDEVEIKRSNLDAIKIIGL
ncbi:CotO family spore coat protein [Bacillus salacetis]|nr:CotO family spore coat protein [Bacillus salacetis]